jgi:hypothetical protein
MTSTFIIHDYEIFSQIECVIFSMKMDGRRFFDIFHIGSHDLEQFEKSQLGYRQNDRTTHICFAKTDQWLIFDPYIPLSDGQGLIKR